MRIPTTSLVSSLVSRLAFAVAFAVVLGACSAEVRPTTTDFAFDGTCVNCHAGLSAGHVHASYKLRCVDCHGGNDQVAVAADAFKR